MFRKINEGTVESDDGFTVKISRTRLSYIRSDVTYSIDIDHLAEPYRLLVYKDIIYVAGREGLKRIELATGDKNRLISNIKDALDFLQVAHQVQ